MTDETATHPNSGLEVNSIADRIEAAIQPSPEPESPDDANPSPEPAETDAEAEADATRVLQPDEVEDAEASEAEDVEADAETDEADLQAEQEDDASDDTTEVPETLDELAQALDVEDLSELRVKVKVDGEESEVPIAEAIRGYQRQQSYDAKMQELRGEKEQFESAVDQATKMWQQKLSSMNNLVTDLEAQVSGQEPNWDHILDTYGSDEFLRQKNSWDQKQTALQAARQEREAAQAERTQAEQQQQAERAAEEQRKLFDAWPELADEEKSKPLVKDMTSYLQSVGFGADELSEMLDHRMYLVARDAMRYRALDSSKAETKKRVKGLPKVLKPNAPKGKQSVQRDKVSAMRQKLRKTGSMDDAADAFKALGI
jgi:hypothetical protein